MSLTSMTGFGRSVIDFEGVQIQIEIKSVNSRFLDLILKLPPVYNCAEVELGRIVRERVQRGRVEVLVVRVDNRSNAGASVSFNAGLFSAYLAKVKEAFSLANITNEELIRPAVVNLLQRREVLEYAAGETDCTEELLHVQKVLQEAADDLVTMRRNEGELLAQEILALLAALEDEIKLLANAAEDGAQQLKERLTARLEKLSLAEIDPVRLAQEVAIVADKVDITEELARLGSHISQFRLLITQNGGGRKLEFLIQEMGREVNTAGNKVQNSEASKHVIEAKAVLEKLREQIQNVE